MEIIDTKENVITVIFDKNELSIIVDALGTLVSDYETRKNSMDEEKNLRDRLTHLMNDK